MGFPWINTFNPHDNSMKLVYNYTYLQIRKPRHGEIMYAQGHTAGGWWDQNPTPGYHSRFIFWLFWITESFENLFVSLNNDNLCYMGVHAHTHTRMLTFYVISEGSQKACTCP